MSKNSTKPPVALFVFNRYEDLQETLDCLKTNDIDKLYIFADGPRNESDKKGTTKVRELIDAIDWVKTEKVYQNNNKGLSESIQSGLDYVFKFHDNVVVVEDDVCVSPGFYGYMCQTLEFYKDDKQVAGITGLRYPFSRTYLDKYEYDVFFAPRFSSWGWGTWKDTWVEMEKNTGKILSYLKSSTIEFSKAGDDIPKTIRALESGQLLGCWDVYCLISMLRNNQVFVWPKNNMVRNNGIGTGSHLSDEVVDWQLEWENQPSKTYKLPMTTKKNAIIVEDFLSFFKTKKKKGINMKKYVKSAINRLGFDVVRKPKQIKHGDIDPKEYTTTDSPQEVPCQKETYFYALNNYIKEGDRVLDVGMGVGYGMNLLSIKAKEVYAVDVDEKAVQACTQNVLGKNPKVKELKAYDGYHLPYKDNYFDVVTCVDVVEHVEDYDKFIDELLRVAKRAVVFGTPNRRPEYTNPDGTPTNYWHLREWSFEEFDKIAKSHAKKVEWTFLNGPYDGPFKITHKVNKDTQVLLPALIK
jgi:2-polyprenyl-3-methyl-5-hydroxy-6-metoxy-1,4-benzoquinol methylase